MWVEFLIKSFKAQSYENYDNTQSVKCFKNIICVILLDKIEIKSYLRTPIDLGQRVVISITTGADWL